MGIEKCLDAKVVAGRLTREQAEDALRLVKKLERQHARNSSAASAEAAAAARAAGILKARAELHQRQTALQILASKRNQERMAAHPAGVVRGALSLLARDRTGKATWSSVAERWRAWEGLFHAEFAKGMQHLRPKRAGLAPEHTRLRDFMNALYGQATDDPVTREAVKAWESVTERARLQANRFGADIAARADWRLPNPAHDSVKVNAAGREAWVAFVDQVGVTVRDFETGTPLAGLERRKLLDEIYDTIATDGLVDLAPGTAGTKKLANRLGERRVLEFDTPEAWLGYDAHFGSRDAYATLTGHMRHMARAIAQLEILGPNPAAEARRLYDLVRIAEARQGKPTGLRLIGPEDIPNTYDVISGAANSPVSRRFAEIAGGVRNVIATARLGKALLTSLSDVGFIRAALTWNELDATKAMGDMLRQFNPANVEDRALAHRLGIVADAWVNEALFAHRLMGDVAKWGRSFVDTFHRVSGLTPWTQAGKNAVGLSFFGELADHVGTPWEKLPAWRRLLEQQGMDAAEWERLGAAHVVDIDGARFLSPERVAAAGELDLAVTLNAAANSLTEIAVPTPDALDRAIVTQGTQPGTLGGEIMRAIFQFKTFTITVSSTHLYGMLGKVRDPNASAMAKLVYLANLLVATTVMGALGMQLKEISSGRDPRDTTDLRFWGQAFLNAGGIGIYGDFLSATLSRADTSIAETAIGPMGQLALVDAPRLAFGNFRQAIEGRDTNAAAELIRFIRGYTPGSSLFYVQLAADRFIFDQLRQAADPKAARAFADMERRRQRDFGQRYWWRPGHATPDRAPSMDAAIGDKP